MVNILYIQILIKLLDFLIKSKCKPCWLSIHAILALTIETIIKHIILSQVKTLCAAAHWNTMTKVMTVSM